MIESVGHCRTDYFVRIRTPDGSDEKYPGLGTKDSVSRPDCRIINWKNNSD